MISNSPSASGVWGSSNKGSREQGAKELLCSPDSLLPWKGQAMIITTTSTVEGHPIEEYLGIVTGEAVLGTHISRDILATFTDIVGGRSREYEEEVQKAREIALEEMASEAESKGANAVVGVDIDYEVIRQGMLMVAASGTAVKLR